MILFLEDFWIAKSQGLRREVEQASYIRVSNDTFNTKHIHPKQHLTADLRLVDDQLQVGVLIHVYFADARISVLNCCTVCV